MTTEIPMMVCQCFGITLKHLGPADGACTLGCMCGARDECCDGTGKVPDIAKMEMDIAKAEKDCVRWMMSDMHEDCCKGTNQVPLLPGLRKECSCLSSIETELGTPHPDGCPRCQDRTWVPNVTMQGLMAAVFSWKGNLSSKYGHSFTVWISTSHKGIYEHKDPYIALLRATWLAIQSLTD